MTRLAAAGVRKPLAGVRILDFFWLIAGPLTTRIFADFGAEVIKVESEQRFDQIRTGGVRPEGDTNLDAAGVFADCNSAKRCITLNLNTMRGVELARELAAVSDIITNNFTGDRMDRWGLGYEELRQINPALVVVSMPAMGASGPWKRYGSNGNGVAAASGFNMLMGFPGRPPVGMGSLYPDFTNPFHAATAIFAALHHRNRTGRGQFLDIGQFQANVSLLDTELLDYSVNGAVPGPNANRSPHACPHGAYRCGPLPPPPSPAGTGEGENPAPHSAMDSPLPRSGGGAGGGGDNWCVIEVTTDEQWQTLCAVMGRADLAADARLHTLAGRKAQEARIDRAVEHWTATRDRWQVMETLQRAGIAAGVVETLQDQLEHDRRMSREHFQRVEHPAGYEFMVQRLPIRLDGAPQPAAPHPSMGADNDYVFGEILGLKPATIDELIADGVLT